MAFWSELTLFTDKKFVVVVDSTIYIRDSRQVIWVLSSQFDSIRDLFILENGLF